MALWSRQYRYVFAVASRISLKVPKGDAARRNILGPVLRKLREDRKLTQAQVIASLQLAGWDVSRQVFSFVEDGSRILSDVELFAILRSLGTSPNDLQSAYFEFCSDFSKFGK